MSTQHHGHPVATYPLGEEIANAVPHGLGAAAAIVATPLLLVKGVPVLSGWHLAGICIYGASMITLFLASTLFLKSAKRIMALMAVMTLCLRVYAALGHRIRQSLAQQSQTFPDQKGKPTARPTARWVFQSFMDIHVLLVAPFTEVVPNLKAHHRALLALLGERYVTLYANSG